jgi:hypothetical protein
VLPLIRLVDESGWMGFIELLVTGDCLLVLHALTSEGKITGDAEALPSLSGLRTLPDCNSDFAYVAYGLKRRCCQGVHYDVFQQPTEIAKYVNIDLLCNYFPNVRCIL